MNRAEEILEVLDIVLATFPLEGELTLPEDTAAALPLLRAGSEAFGRGPDRLPPRLSLTINVGPVGASAGPPVPLAISLPLAEAPGDRGPRFWIPPAAGLPRAARQRLSDALAAQARRIGEEHAEDDAGRVLAMVDAVRDAAAAEALRSPPPPSAAKPGDGAAAPVAAAGQSCVRAWLRFPSLSSRAKRNDLVTCAAPYDITGFVLAGKPGLLCLETPAGSAERIEAYMREIKTVSWADIPPAHKKVSEVWRESGPEVGRHFATMMEITDEIGHRGPKGNKTQGTEIARWLRGHGVGEQVIGKVLGVGGGELVDE